MTSQPDYRHLVEAAWNRKPDRLPMYEHFINAESIAGILQEDQPAEDGEDEFFKWHNRFWRQMGYDTVSYEVCVTDLLPGGGALLGEKDGPIQTRDDFEAYPWDRLADIYWDNARPRFEALARQMPEGMKAVGGVGNGVFEISEDLVGFQKLCYMQVDDPQLFADLYVRIGDFLLELWRRMLETFSETYCVCRIGDDMGFKTQTLLAPQTLREHVVPQYRRVIGQIRQSGKPFLLHSCGKIFDLMDDMIDAGITAKHSNEDAIAPFAEWIDRYNDRIALFGGIDTDRLCRMSPSDIYDYTLQKGRQFRYSASGYALGSGNSIPPYVPREGYLAMIRAAGDLRNEQSQGA
jgi:uroporphyrinogen decarboxylase